VWGFQQSKIKLWRAFPAHRAFPALRGRALLAWGGDVPKVISSLPKVCGAARPGFPANVSSLALRFAERFAQNAPAFLSAKVAPKACFATGFRRGRRILLAKFITSATPTGGNWSGPAEVKFTLGPDPDD
jgi:hypothetical protein